MYCKFSDSLSEKMGGLHPSGANTNADLLWRACSATGAGAANAGAAGAAAGAAAPAGAGAAGAGFGAGGRIVTVAPLYKMCTSRSTLRHRFWSSAR